MSTTAAPKPAHGPPDEQYDSDEARPKNSPFLSPVRVKLRRRSPTPPPAEYFTVSSPPSPDTKKSNRRKKRKNDKSQADAVLVSNLGGNKFVAFDAAQQTLPSETEEESSDSFESGYSSPPGEFSPGRSESGRPQGGDQDGKVREGGPRRGRIPSESPSDMGALDLKSLAAGALEAFASPGAPPEPVDIGPTPPVTEHDVVKERPQPGTVPPAITTTRAEHMQDQMQAQAAVPSPYSPHSLYSPREPSTMLAKMDIQSPTGGLSLRHGHGHGEPPLPPLQMNSPRSETLPPIRSLTGDFTQFVHSHNVERERIRSQNTFPVSPPGALPRLPSIHGHHASPPISPADTFPSRRDPLSPGQSIASVTSPGYLYSPASGHHYSSSNTETPSSDQSGSTPATSIADRMSIEGLTHASYVCTFTGCNAPAFQTQYLLNSHMNVHSSARPHYCPVQGCPRSEGGKGFKRKNEMIRHGLVHDSPGYVCPFCPDREHKYPRPDNLQRHVRVHHVDKDKDDPQLRDVLAQRPDGPSRGRRRRGGPN
ncbi:hypothetical protein B0H66DRAFT_601745 [Apodospora peruviana]|uniref:C2H2-type domain-containing protein n=1 Tax=Apodospora peruviana TaxID=516989 RepID=A0AAE0M803_9PEZI|nr:hypothetical protein B0H66DRAFT_601745 [Apodospora peruviana]